MAKVSNTYLEVNPYLIIENGFHKQGLEGGLDYALVMKEIMSIDMVIEPVETPNVSLDDIE